MKAQHPGGFLGLQGIMTVQVALVGKVQVEDAFTQAFARARDPAQTHHQDEQQQQDGNSPQCDGEQARQQRR